MTTEFLHELCLEAQKTGTNLVVIMSKEGQPDYEKKIFPFDGFLKETFEEFEKGLRPQLIRCDEGFKITHISNTHREPPAFLSKPKKMVKPKRSRSWY